MKSPDSSERENDQSIGHRNVGATDSSEIGEISFSSDGLLEVLNVQAIEIGSITALGVSSATLLFGWDHQCKGDERENTPEDDDKLYNVLGETLMIYDEDYAEVRGAKACCW